MPGASLNLTLPASGDSWPTWSQRVLDCFTAIKNDLEAPVVTSELSMTADLAMNNKGFTDSAYFGCRTTNTAAIPTSSIGIKGSEWWATDGSGNQVQITKNGVLNTTTTGAITGTGYGASGVELNWNSGVPCYSFFEGSNVYADVRMDDLKLRNGSTAEITIGWAGSSSISWLLPASLPASTALLSLDSSGNLSTSATIGTGFTVNNANITLTGTAVIKHPNRTESHLATHTKIADLLGGSSIVITGGSVCAVNYDSAGTATWFAVPLEYTGARLQTVAVSMNKSDANTMNVTISKVSATGSVTDVSSPATSTSTGNVTVTATVTSPAASVAGECWLVECSMASGGSGTRIFTIQPTWDRP